MGQARFCPEKTSTVEIPASCSRRVARSRSFSLDVAFVVFFIVHTVRAGCDKKWSAVLAGLSHGMRWAAVRAWLCTLEPCRMVQGSTPE